jgi:hypothetical protein
LHIPLSHGVFVKNKQPLESFAQVVVTVPVTKSVEHEGGVEGSHSPSQWTVGEPQRARRSATTAAVITES